MLVSGLAIIMGMCTRYSVALCKDAGEFSTTQTAAHEIGHKWVYCWLRNDPWNLFSYACICFVIHVYVLLFLCTGYVLLSLYMFCYLCICFVILEYVLLFLCMFCYPCICSVIFVYVLLSLYMFCYLCIFFLSFYMFCYPCNLYVFYILPLMQWFTGCKHSERLWST